jgi:hypothetical protein
LNDTLSAERIEVFPNGVTREWYDDGYIVVYNVPNPYATTMQTWADVAIQTGVDWPRHQQYLGLHDFSRTHITITPDVYANANRMARHTKHLWGYFCGVVPHTSMAIALEPILRLNILPIVPRLTMRIFFSRVDGLAWLREHMEPSP